MQFDNIEENWFQETVKFQVLGKSDVFFFKLKFTTPKKLLK